MGFADAGKLGVPVRPRVYSDRLPKNVDVRNILVNDLWKMKVLCDDGLLALCEGPLHGSLHGVKVVGRQVEPAEHFELVSR